MEFQVHLHDKQYKEKPLREIPFISKKITTKVTILTPQELAGALGRGQTVVAGIMSNNERIQTNFISQQVVMLDFDNKDFNGNKTTGDAYITLDKLLKDTFILDNAVFVYKTFNYTPEWERLRVVFILETPVFKLDNLAEIYKKLLEQYPQADKSCKDCTRIFFGGTEYLEINFNNTLSVSSLEEPQKNAIGMLLQPLRSEKPKMNVLPNLREMLSSMRSRDKVRLKELLGTKYSVKLASKAQIIRYLKTIDMKEFFGVYANPFFDFFHKEQAPSSSIFKLDDSEIYLYKCYSENHGFIGDIILVTSKLLDCSYSEALDFLIEITGIEIIYTDKLKELREQCEITMELLLSEDLKSLYPETNQFFWRYKNDIVAILNIFKENVYEDSDGNLRSLTWLSVRNLSYKVYGNPNKYVKISRILNLLVYTNWLDKLDEDKIPKELLRKLKEHQNISKFEKRSNVFELLLLGGDFLQELNNQCIEMSNEGFTMKALSQEYVARTHGSTKANKVFVQDKNKTPTKKSNNFYTYSTTIALEEIEKNGYVIEKELMAKIKKRYSKTYTELKYKKCLGELLTAYNLERVRLTKKIKTELNITHLNPKSMPIILKQK